MWSISKTTDAAEAVICRSIHKIMSKIKQLVFIVQFLCRSKARPVATFRHEEAVASSFLVV